MKQQKTMSTQYLGFIPAIVVQHMIDNHKKGVKLQTPEKQSFRSVVMFADISGFTNLTEKLSKIGPEGSEVIAFAINRYMELLVNSISKSGGDIFKFAGDAMIVVWPPPSGKDPEAEIRVLLRQGIQNALEIQAKLNDTFILEDIKLSVKIGFGVGQITIIYVGGVFNRSEYLATGNPLIQAFESEHCATEGGQTIVSQEVYDIISDQFSFKSIEGHSNYFVTGIKGVKVQNISNALMIKNSIHPTQLEEVKAELMRFIPAAVTQFLQVNQEKWSSELRRLSIMFVNLGIDLQDAKTEEGLSQIQQVIETVQKCIYSYAGSLNKLLMDDKGSTLIVVYGLPPMSQQDDAIRAILTAQCMTQQLKMINCKCRIGIATGYVFAGVVGTSGSRREYSVIGDSVNLAARLMQRACQEVSEFIIIDHETAKEASYKLDIKFFKNITVKGKDNELQTYIPGTNQGLRTHNPFYPLQPVYIDRSYEQQILQQKVTDFLSNGIKQCIIVSGPAGIGKTALIQQVLIQLGKMKRNHCTFSCGINAYQQQLPFSGLRTICQQAFKLLTKDIEIQALFPYHKDQDKEQYRQFIALFNEDETRITLGIQKIEIQVDYMKQLLRDLFSRFKCPIVIVIDDAHNLDRITLKILKSLMKHLQMMLILPMRNSYFEQSSSDEKQILQQDMLHEMINEFEPVTEIRLKRLLKTQLIDLFFKQYKIAKVQVDGQSEQVFLNALDQKVQGNPLTLFNFVNSLIKNDYLQIKNDIAIIDQYVMLLIKLDEPICIDSPIDRLRQMSPIFDKVGCIAQLILKTASVIGDTFDIQTLAKVQPFTSSDELLKILQDLDTMNIIEVMESNEFNKYYRFVHSFMREIVYQRLIFAYRRDLHKLVAQVRQDVPAQFPHQDDPLHLEFHWKMAEKKWSQKDTTLSHHAKRSIIIKTIQQKVEFGDPVIRIGRLDKKSDRNITWAIRFCVMTQKVFKYYYTEQDFRIQKEPLGVIPLSDLYSILPLNEKEKGNKLFAFELKAASWVKRNNIRPRREFYFSAMTENEMEEWTIYLEFVRAKAIYDEFVTNFGKIQFPLPQFNDSYNMRLISEGISQKESQIQLRNKRSTVLSLHNQDQELMDKSKDRIKAFLNKSLLVLYSHMFQASMSKVTLGHNTKVLRGQIHLLNLDQSLLETTTPSLSKISMSKQRVSEDQLSMKRLKERHSLQVVKLDEIKEEDLHSAPRFASSSITNENYIPDEQSLTTVKRIQVSATPSKSYDYFSVLNTASPQKKFGSVEFQSVSPQQEPKSRKSSTFYAQCVKNTNAIDGGDLIRKGEIFAVHSFTQNSVIKLIVRDEIRTFTTVDFIISSQS